MRNWLILSSLLLSASQLFAQTRIELNPPPAKLPSDIVDDSFIQFDPNQLALEKVQGRVMLTLDGKPFKDFGKNEIAAQDALRTIRELKVNQYGVISHSTPKLEFWLVDGEAPKKSLSVRNFVPFNTAELKVEKAFGGWILRDDKQVLFHFGNDAQAAEKALKLCKAYGFNQLGFVGSDTPLMTYFLRDPFDGLREKSKNRNPLEMLQSADRIGLLLPEIGIVGPVTQIDARKLELSQSQGTWYVVYETEVLGKFGKDELTARRAMRMLQDFRVTEYVKVGKSGFPLFLSHRQPLKRPPLGFQVISFKPKEINIKETNASWYVTTSGTPMFEMGDTKEDAIMMAKVIQHYQFDRVCVIGNQLQGGLKILMRER